MGSLEGFSTAITSSILLLISINDVISIILCIFLFILAFVFAFIAYKAGPDVYRKVCATVGSVLMLLSAVSSILVDEDFINEYTSSLKSPLYAILSVAIFVSFTIDIVEFVRLLKCSNYKDRLLTNNMQVTYLFLINVIIGLILGFMFGFLDIEDKVDYKMVMSIITVSSLFVGIVVGCCFAFYNEKETQTLEQFGLSPTR